jgi:hypothetical protein
MRVLSSIERVGSEKRRDRWNDNLGPARNSGRLFVLKSKQFFGFIKGTSKNKVTRFFKASASPSASQQKFKFPMVPNKSLTPWFCFSCIPQFMADSQKVSAHLIYFCDLPDLAILRFLFSAKWSRHKIFFRQNLIKVHSNAEKKITTTKRKEASFFFEILAEGDAGILNFFRLCFLLENLIN